MLDTIKNLYTLDLLNGKILEKAAIKLITVNVLLFVIPLMIGDPQLLVGSIVNFLLIYIAINFKENKLLPAIFLPAIASLLRNTLLGSLTVYLAVLLPFIWVANGLFIFLIRGLVKNKHKLVTGLFVSAVAKAIFLFVCTLALVSVFHFPSVLLIAMGILQLATAGIAGICYLGYLKVFTKNK